MTTKLDMSSADRLTQPPALEGFRDAVPRRLCTDCGVSRMADPSACGTACQFIAPNYASSEIAAHGRKASERPDEVHFGVHQRIVRARMATSAEGAQWTGITTGLAADLLRRGKVDAVLAMVPSEGDKWKPTPALITEAKDMALARGMRMGYAPLLALLEPALRAGYKRLAVIGIPCQIHALRKLEAQLELERLYVIGTPCSDNTTTENFHTFLELLDDRPERITYLEFRADYQVELRFDDGTKREIPFLKLPISKLPSNFFPLTCRTCVDYTNRLADITVGYMGGTGEQWLIVRNERGEELLAGLGDKIITGPVASKGKRESHVRGFMSNVERAAGGLPLRAMPDWVRPIVAFMMPKIGPKGQEFARTRVEMKAIETVLHLRAEMPRKMRSMVPPHVWKLVAPYGLAPDEDTKSNRDKAA